MEVDPEPLKVGRPRPVGPQTLRTFQAEQCRKRKLEITKNLCFDEMDVQLKRRDERIERLEKGLQSTQALTQGIFNNNKLLHKTVYNLQKQIGFYAQRISFLEPSQNVHFAQPQISSYQTDRSQTFHRPDDFGAFQQTTNYEYQETMAEDDGVCHCGHCESLAHQSGQSFTQSN